MEGADLKKNGGVVQISSGDRGLSLKYRGFSVAMSKTMISMVCCFLGVEVKNVIVGTEHSGRGEEPFVIMT